MQRGCSRWASACCARGLMPENNNGLMEYLNKLVQYTLWANRSWMLFISKEMEQDEYLLKIVSHILLSEQAWFQRISGVKVNRSIWKPLALNELSELQETHRSEYRLLMEQDPGRIISYQRFSGEAGRSALSDILMHLTTHGAHHRGQMAAYASARGVQPVNTDFIRYSRISHPTQ
ncbi:MAG: DinB family protein [Balneolales bacterium]